MLDLLSDENDTPPARLTEGHIVKVMDRIYHERKNLSLSLLNLESITNALAGFLTGAVVIVTILLLNIVFATGELAEVAITVSSAILGLSFIFATSAQHTFDSFVFLFVRHPYDVGDRILLQGYDPMDVVKMELLHTTFRKWDGFILTLPNYALQSISIFNYKRCVCLDFASLYFFLVRLFLASCCSFLFLWRLSHLYLIHLLLLCLMMPEKRKSRDEEKGKNS